MGTHRDPVQFQPIRAEKISDSVATQIRIEILRGSYVPGDRLPSERELALAFRVNRVTVREALLKLQTLGLVAIRQGTGVEVLDYKSSGKVDLLIHLITTPDADGRYDGRALASLVELSKTLYLQATELAIARMTDEEKDRLCDVVERAQGLAEDVDAFVDNNLYMQELLFEGAHSIALRLLFNTLREVHVAYSSPFRAMFAAELAHGPEKNRLLSWFAHALERLRERDTDGLKRLIETAYNLKNRQLIVEYVKTHTF